VLNFSNILSDLQAAIAVVAARDRSLTVLLVAVWGRIARMRTRLERLVAQWRAGTLPQLRAPSVRKAGTRRVGQKYPSGAGWLFARVWAAGAFGSQLRHLLTDAECAAFLAAVPQAGRILRPLLHMLGRDPVPEVVRKPKLAVPAPPQELAVLKLDGVADLKVNSQFLAV
jgi:hypothetical protein